MCDKCAQTYIENFKLLYFKNYKISRNLTNRNILEMTAERQAHPCKFLTVYRHILKQSGQLKQLFGR